MAPQAPSHHHEFLAEFCRSLWRGEEDLPRIGRARRGLPLLGARSAPGAFRRIILDPLV